jgi:Meiotically Up-regulated Gene 113 (MUG113) protein
MQKILPLVSVIQLDDRSWGVEEIQELKCPECGEAYQHCGTPKDIDGHDSYAAGWPGRGDLIVIPISGECSSEWELCFGFHKGNTASFVRLIKSCKEPKGFVYFIEAIGLSKIKIGTSDNPEKRLTQLTTGAAVPLKLITTIPGDVELEKSLHRRFDHLRYG